MDNLDKKYATLEHNTFMLDGSFYWNKLNDLELLEILADIEHKRWARWQKYLHSLCSENPDGSLTIPKERVDWWNNEIETPYDELTEHVKEYDRIEVRNTIEAINKYLDCK